MKWVLSHKINGLHHWQLQKEDETKLLILNDARLSLRLYGKSKRLFFLDVQGFLQKKILLRTEYGIAIGESMFADKALQGQLLLDGQKLSYQFENNQLLLLDSEKQVVGTCDLPSEVLLEKVELYSLLFGFAWFLTADEVVEKKPLLSVMA